MIDSHTHLDLCAPPVAELVAAAKAVGVRRMLTVGVDGPSCRAALGAAEAFPEVSAAVGRHPNAARGFDDADLAELRALAAHERCLAIGETGLDFYRDGAPRADQQRAFAAQIALARETGKPLVIHTRAAEDQTLSQLAGEAGGVSVVIHCFSMPDRLEECLERGYAISFAGNVTYKSASDLAEAARRVPEDRLLVETDAPYLTPQAVRKERNQPAFVAHTVAFLAELRGVSAQELGATVERNAARVFGWGVSVVASARPSGRSSRSPSTPARESQPAPEPDQLTPREPTQPTLRRIRQFDVRPDRELGQNFLIDSNILGVIDRAAELAPKDVVLEIGGGLGVLSEYLAERVGHVHVVEVDERLREALCDATDPHANVAVHWGDAMTIDLRGCARSRRRWWRTCPTGSRRGRCCARSKSWEASAAGWRWSSARSASAWRRPGQRRLRHAVGDRAARVRGRGGAGDPAYGVPPGAERGLGARAPAPRRPAGVPAFLLRSLPCLAGARRRGVRPPAQDARRLAGPVRASEGSLPRAGAGRAGAARPPRGRARRASLPEDFRALARLLEL